MELTLGRFGDRRLEKGGRFFWASWLQVEGVRFGYGGLVAAGLGRCGSRVFCVTGR